MMRLRIEPRHVAACGVLAAAAALLFVRCTGPRAAALPEVQVLLDRDVGTVDLTLPGSYRVLDDRGASLADGRRLANGRVRPNGDGLELNGVALKSGSIVLSPTADARFEYKGRSYAGELRIRRDATGRLEVANVLDIEEYVAGVLFSEMPGNFPDEALKAQTVAARTYARWRLQNGEPLLRATDADQVYGGAGPTYECARKLVAATRGMVLEVGGQPLCSYFMSTCGGSTVDAPLVFPKSTAAGLTGVRCDWCSASPKYRWTRTLTLAELARRLGLKDVASIDVARDSVGHAIRFDVAGSSESRSFPGQEFRRAWNRGAANEDEKLPSAWARALRLTRTAVNFEGAGFGHGVGLCQYGAAGLANAGRNWRAIVAYYYRGAKLVERW